MKRKTGFFYNERCFWHCTNPHALVLPVGGWVQPTVSEGFAESPETKRRLKNLMDISGLSKQLIMCDAPPVGEDDILRVHSREYLERLKSASQNGGGMVGLAAPVGAGSYEIAQISAGLAMAAVEAVLTGKIDNAYSLSRPPGHHCLPDQGMGFCLLANIAIAIEVAKARYGLGKVAVVDWDVHHGNGTQAIFEQRNDVLTISLHQDRCFPAGYNGLEDRGIGKGEGYNINIPLPAGIGHKTYLQAVDTIVVPALEKFQPELIIVACGFDANAVDPLARMQLHSETFRSMTAKIQNTADFLCNGRLVLVHEGGYSETYVPFCGHSVIEELVKVRTEVEDPMLSLIVQQQPSGLFDAFLEDYVKSLANKFRSS
ncbi:class II histone deacetylase [Pseudomonas asuensis]|uniref:Class II histone deacetylase n=1 Tax=Pseudomonas asuensis TaxID=1825787 RepID=A0ABQ2H502_9PSED|nr:class II histone deacetylase [Pseudomonas asuensis]GGM32908.1 class II histone deacetylase [Pseudomonas asuensis]